MGSGRTHAREVARDCFWVNAMRGGLHDFGFCRLLRGRSLRPLSSSVGDGGTSFEMYSVVPLPCGLFSMPAAASSIVVSGVLPGVSGVISRFPETIVLTGDGRSELSMSCGPVGIESAKAACPITILVDDSSSWGSHVLLEA